MPEVPGSIPGYTSEGLDGVAPESPPAEGVPQGSPAPPETPPGKLADGTDPSQGKVPYDRFKEVNDQNKDLAAQNEELQAALDAFTTPSDYSSFSPEAPASPQSIAPQAVPAEPAPAGEDEYAHLTRDGMTSLIKEVVGATVQPVTQFMQQTQHERARDVEEQQLSALGTIIPEFDPQAERKLMQQEISRRKARGQGFDMADYYLLSHKREILSQLAGAQGAPAPAGSTGHDVGGAPASADDMSPDKILAMIDQANAAGDASAVQALTTAYFQKTGMSQRFGF